MRDNGFRCDDEIAVLMSAVNRRLQRLFEIGDKIARISAKNFVSTLTSKHHLDMARGKLRHHELRKRTGAGDRRVEVIDDFVYVIAKVFCRDLNLLELYPALATDDLGIRALVIARKF